jgi:hypothetical protein
MATLPIDFQPLVHLPEKKGNFCDEFFQKCFITRHIGFDDELIETYMKGLEISREVVISVFL